MSARLPATYNFLLFLVSTLLYPVAGLLVGDPFTEPTIAELLVIPAVIVLFANVGYYAQRRQHGSGIVDERDVRNIDLALAGTGIVLLGSILAIYVGYATTSAAAPSEIDYLALVGVVTVFAVVGGTELHQRL